jgi:hypothetical protein
MKFITFEIVNSTMQRFLGLILFVYFLSGTLLLPQGDFSTLPDIPKMYAHCRDTEDPDMNALDFLTGHLLSMDDLMGNVLDPEDKPHAPVEFHHIYSPITITISQIDEVVQQPASVFRPPIA